MDQLPKSAQDAIRKCFTLRLQHNLLRVGDDEDDIDGLERPQLIAAWAQIVAEGKDKPVEGATATVAEERAPPGYDPEVERERLQWEREKFDGKMKLEEEKMRMEAEVKDEL